MRKLAAVISALFILIQPAAAQDRLPLGTLIAPVKTPQQRYEDCRAVPYKALSDETNELFCACKAAGLQEKMTPADLATMDEKSKAGRKKYDFMLTDIVAPCMEYPTQELMKLKCETDPYINRLYSYPDGQATVCGCVGDRMAKYAADSGMFVMIQVLKEKPEIIDPVPAFLEQANLRLEYTRALIGCRSGGEN